MSRGAGTPPLPFRERIEVRVKRRAKECPSPMPSPKGRGFTSERPETIISTILSLKYDAINTAA